MSVLKERGFTAAPADKLARQSFPGMAHFAGTSPTGDGTCRECKSWDREHPNNQGAATCHKFRQLTNQRGGNVPSNALACKYFDRLKL
jgi:hypothetical protein